MGIRARVRSKTRWLCVTFGWCCAAVLTVATLPVVAGDARVPYEAWFLGFFVALAVGLVLRVIEARRVSTTSGIATADRAGLAIGTRTIFRREDVRHAFVVDATTLRVVTKRHDFEIGCERGAAALIAALQLGARESVAHFRLRRNAASWFLRGSGMALTLAVTLVAMSPLFVARVGWLGFRLCPLQFLWLAVWVGGFQFRPIDIVLGSDGVRWPEGPFSHRFIPFSEISEVQLGSHALVLLLRNGIQKRAHFDEPAWEAYPMRHQAMNLAARIRERLDAVRERGPRLAIAHGREEVASYRAQGLPADALWRIVEDGSYAPELRQEAVATLEREPNNALALRAITEASADPDLRGALRARSST